jgi:intracellular septation protein
MKLLLDYLPIAVFVAASFMSVAIIDGLAPYLSAEHIDTLRALKPMVFATMILIPLTILQILAVRLIWGKVEKMHWITLAILIILGTLTLIFNNQVFIQWKPSIVNWAFALGFIGYQMFTGNTLLERMMSANLELPDAVWTKLSHAWVLFFVVSGALNLIVAYNFSEETWLIFKFFGLLGLTIIFIIAQGVYLTRYIKEEPK